VGWGPLTRLPERGVAVEGVAALRVASGGPPALMLGFARLPEHRIAQAVRLLAEAITMTRPGGPPTSHRPV
jgi:GntR family transcriptional regulator/MocR family aminotransferase